MNLFKIFNLLVFNVLAGCVMCQVQDCSTAQILCNKDQVLVPSVSGPGFPDDVLSNSCFGDIEHQSHWFTFYATKSGSFELSINAIAYQADYDFSLWQDECPGSPGSINVACNWNGGVVVPPYVATGIATNPTTSFSEPANLEYVNTINLIAGHKYYLLVDNITANGIGFLLRMGGTASIGEPELNYSAGIFCNQSSVDLSGISVVGIDSVPGTEAYYAKFQDALDGTNPLVPPIVSITGNYYVKKTTPHGCAAIETIKVTLENPDVVIDDVYTCGVSPFNLNNIVAVEKSGLDITKFTFTFFNTQSDLLNGTNPISSKLVTNSGTYWARAESLNGCVDIIPFNVSTVLPNVSLTGQDIICAGESIAVPLVYNGNFPADITLGVSGGGAILDNLIVGEPLIVHPQKTTTYTVLAMVDADGCSASISGSYTVIVNEIPLIDNVTIDCQNDPAKPVIVVTASSGDQASYTISGVTGSFNGSIFTSDPLISGQVYTIQLTDKNNCGSSGWTDTVKCECDPNYKLDLAGIAPKCFNSNDGQISAIISGGKSPYNYSWSTGSSQKILTNVGGGSYILVLTDSLKCVTSDTITLKAPLAIDAEVNTSGVTCFGDSDGILQLSDIYGGVGPYLINMNNQQFTSLPVTLNSLPAGSYQVEIIDDNACKFIKSYQITNGIEFNVDLGKDKKVLEGSLLEVIPTGNINEIVSYQWSSSESLPCINCEDISFNPLSAGFVSLLALNDKNCPATDTMYYEIIAKPRPDSSEVFIPNIFSPNGDGINDFFKPFFGNISIETGDLKIYNRWGGIMYSETFLDEPKGWNGKFNNEYVNSGVYLFTLALKINGQTKVYKGDITTKR